MRSVGVLRDRTDQKQLERELRVEREHFRVALENSPFTAFRLDTDLRYTWLGAPHSDFDAEAVLGKRDDELLPPEAAETVMAPKREVLIQMSRGDQVVPNRTTRLLASAMDRPISVYQPLWLEHHTALLPLSLAGRRARSEVVEFLD